ncbi:MAG: hypothetical protein RBU45_16260 [Myxococcota bacterium]|nr:hypothetical protein [Myxococcota bacterium]
MSLGRAELAQASVDALRTFYGVDTGFEDGTALFQEIREEAIPCTMEDSYLAYRVMLPDEFKPRPQYTYVAVIWALDGSIDILVTGVKDKGPGQVGSNPLGAIFTFSKEVSNEEAQAIAGDYSRRYPRATVDVMTGDAQMGPAIMMDFGRTQQALDDSTLSANAVQLYADLAADTRVVAVNLRKRAFSQNTRFGDMKTINSDTIVPDCLRTFTSDFKRLTITDLAAPLGPGRHYNLVECPIQNWPPECEYESSDECREAMEAT